jgi:hypothetical protein
MAPAPLSPVDEAALESVTAGMRAVLDDARRARPAEGSQEETAVLQRFWASSLSFARVLGPAFLVSVRSGVNESLSDLVRKEVATAEAERKLALRHIEQAVHRYGVMMESLGSALAELPAASSGALIEELAEHVPSEALKDAEARLTLRFQLDVMVALDVLDAPLDELSFWAFRALTDARRVEAIAGATSPAGLRGELARHRSQRSWVAWDAAEIAKELAPWPTPSR